VFGLVSDKQLHEWYIVERLSYRQIMQNLGINNARAVKRMLVDAGIEIRRGADAVKTQWENNPERREKQANWLSSKLSGRPSGKRLSEEEIAARLLEKKLIYNGRDFSDGYTKIKYTCFVCGQDGETSLRGMSGCPRCAVEEQHQKQRTPFAKIKKAFDGAGLVLLATSSKNQSEPLPFICPRHMGVGVQYRSYEKTLQRNGCKYCTYDNWKRTVTSETEKERKSWKASEWRKAVFERDNYTCQCCEDDRGGNLQAHHVRNFSSNNALRFMPENGITLCRNCHDPSMAGSFHNIYGTRDNTPEQLTEYLEARISC